jgi:hypothetical protein
MLSGPTEGDDVEIGRPRRIITVEPDADPVTEPAQPEPAEEPVPAGPDDR